MSVQSILNLLETEAQNAVKASKTSASVASKLRELGQAIRDEANDEANEEKRCQDTTNGKKRQKQTTK